MFRSRGSEMANVKDGLAKLREIDFYVGAAIVDSNSGMMLGADGAAAFNLEVAAAGNTEVVRAKRHTMRALDLKDSIEDILISLARQYHVIRPLAVDDAVFIYVVLDRSRANLAMARMKISGVERELVLE